MPFTFSHPAIVLPLTYLPRKWVSVTGLVIGSLTPDFEYFLRMKVQSNYSHTIAGLFWFDLPLGIILAILFHGVVRDGLFDNLPEFLKSRLNVFMHFDWNKYFNANKIVVLSSVLIGAASHIFWDSFTHDHGYFVQIIPALTNSVDFFGNHVRVLKILQHSSTFLGGLAIAIAILRLPVNKETSTQVSLKYWTMIAGLTVVIIVVRLFSGLDYKLYGHLVVTSISAFLISLVLSSLIGKQFNLLSSHTSHPKP
ncbi:MAG: DUF4184 family protein [Bacteroidia bacterium]|nr:DUF4184 family protein [Bacteroidia bacterium]MBP7261681.1 DUF4184 family protein [Bacteroidia bacterium]MBP9181099.1 DUF4184 family protein [Bacteroidia bacterium]MBP9725508.1 DUF4184 family protein [Bacteroidia bacterium]